jgi:hypothetical protein
MKICSSKDRGCFSPGCLRGSWFLYSHSLIMRWSESYFLFGLESNSIDSETMSRANNACFEMGEKNHITRARLIIRSMFFTVFTASVIFV